MASATQRLGQACGTFRLASSRGTGRRSYGWYFGRRPRCSAVVYARLGPQPQGIRPDCSAGLRRWAFWLWPSAPPVMGTRDLPRVPVRWTTGSSLRSAPWTHSAYTVLCSSVTRWAAGWLF